MTVFDERELKDQLFAQNAKDVYESIVQYDEEMVPIMNSLNGADGCLYFWRNNLQTPPLEERG